MADNKDIAEQRTSHRINLRDTVEVGYWCRRFGCTEKHLLTAATAVGSDADKICARLALWKHSN
jgi:hypothetical protein